MENSDNKKIVEIIVKNDAENIEEINADKVFDRFYKVDKSRSQTSTGLGLAIAKEMNTLYT
ncbi:MAG: hypothetical protein IJA34_05195 [Lachnospiraceae bacterium]|nr:hypothetical protein [Lachnospiraceae bacterium]